MFAGAMDWLSDTSGQKLKSVCSETQRAGEGHSHSVFAVKPIAAWRQRKHDALPQSVMKNTPV
jgi:hypothetical protein